MTGTSQSSAGGSSYWHDGAQNVPLPTITILCGDLNAEPHHAVIDRLKELGFEDTHDMSDMPEHQELLTFNAQEDLLVKRIDFVMVKRWSGAASIRVNRFEALGTPIGRDSASDHLGLHVAISIEMGSTL